MRTGAFDDPAGRPIEFVRRVRDDIGRRGSSFMRGLESRPCDVGRRDDRASGAVDRRVCWHSNTGHSGGRIGASWPRIWSVDEGLILLQNALQQRRH